jgi:L-asparaginase
VTKNVVSRVDTWESLDTGALGIISGGEADFYRAPLRKSTTASEFSLDGIERARDLPKVEILYSYADADPALVKAAVNQAKADGIVMAAFATGTPHIGQRAELEKAVQTRGTAVVIGNRGSSGRISSSSGPFIGGDNLTPQKALILLKFALSVTDDRDEIQRIFDEY